MSTGSPVLPPATATTNNNLFAAVDIGTNSFKLTVVRVDPSSGRFLTFNRLKEPVILGLDTTTTSSAPTISAASLDRAITAVRKFQHFIHSHRLPPSHLRLVATSAVREASNKSQFIGAVNEALGLNVEVISGEEEARLIYLGILQFFPVFTSTVLTIDIGGGSTEFTVGLNGNVLFSKSLRLGHVTLTQQFSDVTKMREHIRSELEASDLIGKINDFKIDAVIGSSGTIRAIEKAVCKGYARKIEENVGVFEEFTKREWRFTRHELRCLVERLYDEERTVLLDEVFEKLAIEEIEVSEYALGEGVITEMLGHAFQGFDLNANARWRSVFKLAMRFNNKKRMKAATMCATIARVFIEFFMSNFGNILWCMICFFCCLLNLTVQEIFEGLMKSNQLYNGNDDNQLYVPLDDSDLEYLDAASLLHNIGMSTGKKGYHKQSYFVIMNGDELQAYSKEEIKIIALLVRYHRKKFPKNDVLEGSSKEVRQKFRILCAIMRVSYAVQQCLPVNFQFMGFIHSPEGFKLVLSEGEARNQSTDIVHPLLAGDMNVLMEKEFEHFSMVLKQKLSILVT
ncbi:hypothetical protein MIMGU_mgv1a003722mg [Erythranthe guttata]|uniref:Uncharacterized protein n=1 Tax=Erythranthe guttata TaxID=4155 RepID=A0A022RA85_ERYGU|nr:hypothetical protein MIMGU_mgv1a003722mg [Erythranthe guttata]